MTSRNRGGFIIPLIIAIAFTAAGYFVDPTALTDDGFPLNYFFYFMAACFGLPAIVMALGLGMVQRNRENVIADLQARGVEGIASIVTLEDTGVRINDNPRVKMELEIHLDGHTPYRIEKTMTVPLIYLPQVQPGQTVLVLADPHDPERVELLWGGQRP